MPRMHPLEERWSSLFTFALEVQVHFLYAVQIPPDTGREAEGRVTRQSPVASPASPLSLSLRFQLHPVEFGAPLKSLKPFGPVKRIQKELQEETQWLTFCNLDLCWSYVSKILEMIISNRASHFLWGFFSTFPGLKVFYLTSFHKSLRKTRPVSIQRPPQQRQPQQPQSQELDPNQQRPKKHEVQTSCNNAMILGESLLVLWFRQQPNSEKNWNSPSDPSHPRPILRCFVSRPMHEFIRPEEKEKKLKSFANPKSPSDSEISIQI